MRVRSYTDAWHPGCKENPDIYVHERKDAKGWVMNGQNDGGSYDRGSFACVGSDDRIHSVTARVTRGGRLALMIEGGTIVKYVVKGRYLAIIEGVKVTLRCDHPDAP